MKTKILVGSVILLTLLQVNKVKAQDTEKKLSTITLSVVPPSNFDRLTESALSKLETKVIDIVTTNGLSAEGYNQSFIIQSKFEINNVQETSGGMRKIVTADCNFNLAIKQQATGTIFSSLSKPIQGTGSNKDEAVGNAIQQINSSDEGMQSFIEKGKSKIAMYFTQNCESIMRKAETEKGFKKYESALAILLTVPEEAQTCYKKAQEKAVVIFAEYQKNNCGKLLQQAKAYVAGNDYDNAMRTLSYIDPSLPCSKEANSVLKSFASKVSDDKKKSWDYTFKALEGNIEAQKASYQAMNNLTLGWLASQANGRGAIIIK